MATPDPSEPARGPGDATVGPTPQPRRRPVWEGGSGPWGPVPSGTSAAVVRPVTGWPTLRFRSRFKDTLLAVIFTVIAVGVTIAAAIVLVTGEREDGVILAGLSLVWWLIVAGLWRLRNRWIELTDDALRYRNLGPVRTVAYRDIVEVRRASVRGVRPVTRSGRTLHLPTSPQRTANGWGNVQPDEIADHLEARVADAHARDDRP